MEKNRTHLRLNAPRSRGLVTSAFFAFTLSALISILILAMMAFFSYESDDPTQLITPFSYASLAISALVFGFFTAKFSGRSTLACGFLSGATLSSLLLLFGLLFTENYNLFIAIPVIASIFVVSFLGSFFGSSRKTKKRSRMRA